MTILEHISELRTRLIRIAIAVIIITAAVFMLRIEEFTFSETKIYLPYPMGVGVFDINSTTSFVNIPSQILERVQADVLPLGVKSIVTEAHQAMLAIIYVSLFIGIVGAMPVIIREITAFIGPALYPEEKARILKLLLPGTVLFLIGVAFAYYFVTPWAFRFLYGVAGGIVEETFITIDNLMSFVLLFAFGGGLSFQLPIIMWLVTVAGIVDYHFWRRNFRYAIVAIVIFGAVITPDASGITMWFIALPMVGLYWVGYYVTKRRGPKP